MRIELFFTFIAMLICQSTCHAQTTSTNVYSIPAACDGVTDDTMTINNFLTSLGRGTAILPKGDCRVLSQINMVNGVYLKGQGKGGQWSVIGLPTSYDTYPTRLMGAGGTGTIINFPSGAANTGFSDLTIDIGKPNNGTVYNNSAVNIAACYEISIENATIENAGTGINIAPTSPNTDGLPDPLHNCGQSTFRHIDMINVFRAITITGQMDGTTKNCVTAATDNTFYDVRLFDFWNWDIALGSCADNNYFYSAYLAQYNPNTYGIIINYVTPMVPTGLYGEYFYNTIFDLFNSTSNPQTSILAGAVGDSFGNAADSPSMFIGGYLGQNTATPAHPVQSVSGAALFQFTSPGDSNVQSCTGAPSTSFTSVHGFVTHC